ncbi:apyrase [Malassezia nana]|uniref:Apyrase n=1 Tax=Malassezia nana TaxID=180528 RepID=A0AAF0EK36_9BASI|nr:apyrase [Malassezia nana]
MHAEVSSPSRRSPVITPAPSAAEDSDWGAHRKYIVIVDAGSSGSRLQVYSWRDLSWTRKELLRQKLSLHVLPSIERGAPSGSDKSWQVKLEPGLSSFADNLPGLRTYLTELLDHVYDMIPSKDLPHTPIYVHATAGMRLLPPEQRQAILLETCRMIRAYPFAQEPQAHDFTGADPDSACSGHVRVISGEEEGLFGWLAINYLMRGFEPGSRPYGFLDMGGASSQIAFEPSEADAQKDLFPVSLRRLDGSVDEHAVFVTTFLGFGTNEARLRYLYALTDQANMTEVSDPCLPKGLRLSGQQGVSHVVGAGSFAECLAQQKPLLHRNATCATPPCPFHGVHVPSIQFDKVPFVGVSEYWYSSDDVFALGGAYHRDQLDKAAEAFCQSDWHALAAKFDSHEYREQVTPSRLQMQCFKAAWVSTFLHEGLALPRENSAQFFQSVNEVQGVGVSWTLGKALLEASREISRHEPVSTPWAQSFWVSRVLIASVALGALYLLWKRFLRHNKRDWQPVPVSEASGDAEEHRLTITMPSDTASPLDVDNHPEDKRHKKSHPWGRVLERSMRFVSMNWASTAPSATATLPQVASTSRRPSAVRSVSFGGPARQPRDESASVPPAWASMSDSEHGSVAGIPSPSCRTPTPSTTERSRTGALSRVTSPVDMSRPGNVPEAESLRDDSVVISTALSSGLWPSQPPSRGTSPMPVLSTNTSSTASLPLLSPLPTKPELRGRISPL